MNTVVLYFVFKDSLFKVCSYTCVVTLFFQNLTQKENTLREISNAEEIIVEEENAE